MGISGICPGPNLSKRNLQHPIFAAKCNQPNHIWVTYIRLVGGWMYMVAVLDWYSRQLGTRTDPRNTLCVESC